MNPVSDPISYGDAIILGIIQGLTEFFPVSSDGHLVLGQHFLGFGKHNLMFDVLLHFGTLGAIILVFRQETGQLYSQTKAMFTGVLKGRWKMWEQPEQRAVLWIWITTFVTGLLGLIFEDQVEETFSSVQAAGIGFLITSTFLFLASYLGKGDKTPQNLTVWFPILIGVAQAAALLPGVSRSGMTIATALIFGCRRFESGKYSFTAAIPIIAMAVLYQARKLIGHDIADLPAILLGVAVSFLVGIAAIKGLMAMLTKFSLVPFAVYAFLLGVLTIGMTMG